MRTLIFQGQVTAVTSLSHNGGESYGINSKLRREKFVLPDLTTEEIPVVSGNSIRGVLRDVGMMHMCRVLGMQLNLPAFHFLFSGGALSSDGGKAIDIDEARRVRELIPLVGVLGGALGNVILPGKADIGKLIPICSETAHLLPEKFTQGRALPSFTAYIQEEMYTRKDDAKNENMTAVIAAPQRKLLEDARAAKKAKADQPQDDTGQHQQMMYYVETLAAGTPFYWQVCLRDVTDIEFEAFVCALAEWSKRPVIGGKANVGMGQVMVRFEDWISIDSRVVSGGAVGMPLGQAYEQHLRDNAAKIAEFLRSMHKAA